jgi:23S rRNA (guanosine2251-2'-O)-methyltransferase
MEHLEGRQSVLAALRARQRKFQVILVSHGAHLEKFQDVLDLAKELGVPVKSVDRRELDAMAHGQTHGGMVALAGAKPRMNGEQMLEFVEQMKAPPLLLLLEGVEDARNLGFTLRTAEALGAHAVLIKKHLWDFDPVEVARPASGAYERMPLVQIDTTEPLVRLQRKGMKLYGCIAGAKRRIYDVDMTGGTILAIGGEKRGLSGAVRSLCDRFVTIPTAGEATSMSLSHASAIICAEAMRQRLFGREAQAAAAAAAAPVDGEAEVSRTASPDPQHLPEGLELPDPSDA